MYVLLTQQLILVFIVNYSYIVLISNYSTNMTKGTMYHTGIIIIGT